MERRYGAAPESPEGPLPSASFTIPADEPRTTGRMVVVLEQDAPVAAAGVVEGVIGTHLVSTADFPNSDIDAETFGAAEGVLFDQLTVALVRADPDQEERLVAAAAAADQPVRLVEPERVVYAAEAPADPVARVSLACARAYLDGATDVIERLGQGAWAAAPAAAPQAAPVVAPALDETRATWGLQATGVLTSTFTGQGVRVAVLDTGIDKNHPDFLGRVKAASSFVPGEDVQDVYGHGTHCAGTACGLLRPEVPPRYGVIAHAAELYVGKVLNNRGRGADGQILAGVNWAMANQCHVVSMSISGRRLPGERFSSAFEEVAQRAMAAGVLLVAAAGNDSNRQNGLVLPVGHPADCPSILAVGAIDVNLQVANFSNSSINLGGGQVDLAGPGVDIYSSWPLPRRYLRLSGTSMATPHVAGIAALYIEANPNISPAQLSGVLTRDARRLPLTAVDVGSGLVQAP